MNLYQMYMNNGLKYGYFVRNDKWARTKKAYVFLIGQTKEGDPLDGKPPYYNNPTVILKAYWMKGGYEIVTNGGWNCWELVSPQLEL